MCQESSHSEDSLWGYGNALTWQRTMGAVFLLGLLPLNPIPPLVSLHLQFPGGRHGPVGGGAGTRCLGRCLPATQV